MKTSEFIARVEELGFSVEHCVHLPSREKSIEVISNDCERLVRVGVDRRFIVDSFYFDFEKLGIATQEALFDLVVEYAKTPIEERGEEKKYYLRLPIYCGNEWNYLSLDRDAGKYFIRNKEEVADYQTKFTMEEIEKLREEYNLDSFEIVEVEE